MASTIKVDNVQNQPGTNIVSKCGTTVTVGAGSDTTNVPGAATVTGNLSGAEITSSSNVVKSNAFQAADAGNIISQSGTTVTLGASGDTIALASGASQTGFGRTGTVDWDTTPKTATFSGVNGNGYFCNTTAGAFTINLPAGVAGNIVGVSDYASTFNTNNLTVARNGTDKINGGDGDAVLSTQGLAVSFVFVDTTRGWKTVTGSDANTTGIPPSYLVATGGNQPTAGGCIVDTDYKIHKFTGPGTFCVSCGGNAAGSNSVEYMIIAGGGGAGGAAGTATASGGGGAGGYRESPGSTAGSYTVSPLGVAPAAAVPITATGYPISIGGGGGGAGGFGNVGGTGTPTTALGLTAGGGGGSSSYNSPAATSGGSGGGGSAWGPSNAGAAGNSPPTTPPQGQPGGTGSSTQNSTVSGAGGGGATDAGNNSPDPTPGDPYAGGIGGVGATSSIDGTPTQRAGGGGGGSGNAGLATGGGGQGGPGNGTAGTVNTGGGGGGAATPGSGSNSGAGGGSGLVIIRYKFQ